MIATLSLEKQLCELFGGKVLPDWYLKMPNDFYENWPREGYVKEVTDRTDRRQWWLEMAASLLVQPKPDKGLLRAAIESQRISNPDMAEKLKERMRLLR